MSGWLYWALFALAALLCAAPWAAHRLEERRERLDREMWERLFP